MQLVPCSRGHDSQSIGQVARFVRVIEAKLTPVHSTANLILHVPGAANPLGEALVELEHHIVTNGLILEHVLHTLVFGVQKFKF